jgi:putative lipoprotein (rSAM/lipoprotein system)
MKASRIITGLLALLGFSGCDIIQGRYEYGTPYSLYTIKGRVTDPEGEPVRDIKIVVENIDELWAEEYAVGITDASGSYFVGGEWYGRSPFVVTAEDIDGSKNGGEFAPATMEITIEKGDFVGGDGEWYGGRMTKEVDFTLELKPQQEDENE